MKKLIRFLMLLIPFLMYAQPDSLKVASEKNEIKELLQIKEQKKKAIDSMQSIKLKELRKQQSLIARIQVMVHKIFIKPSPKIKDSYRDTEIKKNDIPLVALKPQTDAIYCEDCYIDIVERTFFGKIFNKTKIRTRTFRYENGIKVYLD